MIPFRVSAAFGALPLFMVILRYGRQRGARGCTLEPCPITVLSLRVFFLVL